MCSVMDLDVNAILILLAVATLFLSPAVTVPIRVIIMRLIQTAAIAA